MKTSAFYSEQLNYLPGRLHITEDRIYVELVVSEGDIRSFKVFDIKDFGTIVNFLDSIKFFEGNDALIPKVKKEIGKIRFRASGLQRAIFASEFSKKEKKEAEIIEEKPKVEEPVVTTEPKVLESKVIENTPSEKDIPIVQTGKSTEAPKLEFLPVFNLDINPAAIDEIAIPSELRHFAQEIVKFESSSDGLVTAHDKAILMLTVVGLYDEGSKSSSEIRCDEAFISAFIEKYMVYLHYKLRDAHQRVPMIFKAMEDVSFWKMLNSDGKTAKAQIDSKLASGLMWMKGRKAMRKLLFHTYFHNS